MAEYNSWEKEEDLENMKELVAKFKEKMTTKVRRQEKLDIVEEKDFRRVLWQLLITMTNDNTSK